MNPARQFILDRLADGGRHSGADLAAALGMSRAAVGRHVRLLRAAGWPIHGQAGVGYRLEGSRRPLRRGRIEQGLRQAALPVEDLEVLAEVDSTSAYLAAGEFADDGGVRVCIAEYQTAGRGRRGRHWQMPRGSGIAFSLARCFPVAPVELAGLGVVAGTCVTASLRRLGVPAALKWPNDVVVEDRKLAGILIDIAGESTGPSRVVIGVGVNHDLEGHAEGIGQAVTDLVTQGLAQPRDDIIIALIADLLAAIARLERNGVADFAADWQDLDALAGREVRVFAGERVHGGRAMGIDPDGALRVALADGVHRFLSGDVSVRADDGQ